MNPSHSATWNAAFAALVLAIAPGWSQAQGDEPRFVPVPVDPDDRKIDPTTTWHLTSTTYRPEEAASTSVRKPSSWRYAERTTVARAAGGFTITREFTSRDLATVYTTEEITLNGSLPPAAIRPGDEVRLKLWGNLSRKGEEAYSGRELSFGIVAMGIEGGATSRIMAARGSTSTFGLTVREPKGHADVRLLIPKAPSPVIRITVGGPAAKVTYEYRRAGDEPPEPETELPKIVELKAFDANPLFAGKGSILPERLDQEQLMLAEAERDGLAADGVTQLILRAEVSHDVPVVFRLPDEKLGTLKPLLDGKTITVKSERFFTAPKPEDSKFYAFALLTAASTINDPEAAVPTSPVFPPKHRVGLQGPECLELSAEAIPYFKSKPVLEGKKTLPLKLTRKPVVLVHGLFSNPVAAWVGPLGRGRSLAVLLEKAGMVPFLVNYAKSNGGGDESVRKSGFEDNWKFLWECVDEDYSIKQEVRWLKEEHAGGWLGFEYGGEPPILSEFQKPDDLRIGGIGQALEHYRDKLNIAATQADVVGHSMGGLLARAYASEDYNKDYKRAENFNRGDISRILTISTPHHGSELAELVPVLQLGRIGGESVVNWTQRVVASLLFRGLVANPEAGALRDLAPESSALKRIGATPIPAYAVGSIVTDEQMRNSRHDPGRTFSMAYEGIGLLFFHNAGLLEVAVDKRARQWSAGGKPHAHDGRGPGAGLIGRKGVIDYGPDGVERYKAILQDGIDDSVYYWASLRESAYQDVLKNQAEGTMILPPDSFDWEEEPQGSDMMASLVSLGSKMVVNGDVTKVKSDSITRDAPPAVISMLRSLIFHNDPANDAAVREVSQRGGLPDAATNIFKKNGITHSFTPWDYEVQRHVIQLLRWKDDKFHKEGFPAAGVRTPRFLPSVHFAAARVEGPLAIAWSGMVKEHAEVYAKAADDNDCIILVRPVNQDSTVLIAGGAATKGMAVKGKSSNWGPHSGFIPIEQRFSKIWRTKRDGERIADINEYNTIMKDMVKNGKYPDDPKNPHLKGRPFVEPRDLVVKIAGKEYEVLIDPKSLEDPRMEIDSEDAVFLFREGELFDWRSGSDDKERGIFDRDAAPTSERKIDPARARQILATKTPLKVCADGLSLKESKPYLTADYDLLAIGYHDDGDPGSVPKHVQDAEFNDVRGFISGRQWDLVEKINEEAFTYARYPSGNLTHHGPEVQYAKSPYVDYPILVCDPGEPKVRGDGRAFIILMGPVGYRDINLKRYFTERMRDGFTLWPNLVSEGWQWERWGKFDYLRGYDPRDSPTLKSYVDEQPRPENEEPVSAFDHLPPE